MDAKSLPKREPNRAKIALKNQLAKKHEKTSKKQKQNDMFFEVSMKLKSHWDPKLKIVCDTKKKSKIVKLH